MGSKTPIFRGCFLGNFRGLFHGVKIAIFKLLNITQKIVVLFNFGVVFVYI